MLKQFSTTFCTKLGGAIAGDSLNVLAELPEGCASLIFTSPPFEGEETIGLDDLAGARFVSWLNQFMGTFERVLQPNGSVVLELGATWVKQAPMRSVQNASFIAELVRAGRWLLLQEFYWYNPRFLDTPHVWVHETHTRFRDSVTMFWWLGRSPDVYVDTSCVHGTQGSILDGAGNLLAQDDGPEDIAYLDRCSNAGVPVHQERFPLACPAFFIEFLTKPGDWVIDPFAGSCATGAAAELLGRRWLCIEREKVHLLGAALRFECAESNQ